MYRISSLAHLWWSYFTPIEQLQIADSHEVKLVRDGDFLTAQEDDLIEMFKKEEGL